MSYSGFFGHRKSGVEVKDEKPGLHDGNKFNARKWFWLIIMEKLINKLNMSLKEVEEMNYIGALNWLSLWKEKENAK